MPKPGGVHRIPGASPGAKQWEFVTVTGHKPDGRPVRERRRFMTKAEADREWAKVRHELDQGTHVRRWDGTVSDVIDSYLRSATFERSDNTRVSYHGALLPVTERLGQRKARSITREDIEGLRDWMLTEGRRRGGKAGTPLSPRSVRLTLGRLSAAFELAIDDHNLAVNPVQHVRFPAQAKAERATWTATEVRQYLATASKDRLYFALRLAVYGLRRGEIAGLQWSDLSLGDSPTISIGRSRVLVNYKIITKTPKSANSVRTLDLDPDMAEAARALQLRQMEEAEAAGEAYSDAGYVVCDELGQPLNPERITDLFQATVRAAGVPRIRLHDGRHSTLSFMHAAGVPIAIISKWAGHYSPAFTMATYVHADRDGMAVAATVLGALYGSEVAS